MRFFSLFDLSSQVWRVLIKLYLLNEVQTLRLTDLYIFMYKIIEYSSENVGNICIIGSCCELKLDG